MIYLDTHAAIWLAEGKTELFGIASLAALEAESVIRISPMVALELQFLHEIGRLTVPGGEVLRILGEAIALTVCQAPFPAVSQAALGESWVRDPFDRIIVAQARLSQSPLITKDRLIRTNYPLTVW